MEQLKERFEKMNLSYDAYRFVLEDISAGLTALIESNSVIEYVGTRTLAGKSTDFGLLKAVIGDLSLIHI